MPLSVLVCVYVVRTHSVQTLPSLALFLQTFVPDEDTGAGKRGREEETSWLQTVELTHTRHHSPGAGGVVRGLGIRGEVLQNPLYDDEDDDQGQEGEGMELSPIMESDWALSPPSPTHSSDL